MVLIVYGTYSSIPQLVLTEMATKYDYQSKTVTQLFAHDKSKFKANYISSIWLFLTDFVMGHQSARRNQESGSLE